MELYKVVAQQGHVFHQLGLQAAGNNALEDTNLGELAVGDAFRQLQNRVPPAAGSAAAASAIIMAEADRRRPRMSAVVAALAFIPSIVICPSSCLK